MDVSIIIITYNSEKEIEDCLQSVYNQQGLVAQQVVVLDNLSRDLTVKIVKEKFPQVKLIEPGENLGFAKGVNRAIESVSTKYVLLLNPDTRIIERAIDKIVEFAEENPGHGLYGGRTLQPDMSLEPSSCWGLPSLWSHFTFATGLSTLFKRSRVFDPESLGKWQRDTVREVGIITGCFLLSTKEHWDSIKGFDERYFMYGEDADLAMRTRALGMRPIICPDAQLIHEVGKSSKTPTHKMMLLYKGKACLALTHWSGLKQKLALFFLLAGVTLRAIPSLLSGNGGEEAEGYVALLKKRREWLAGYPNS
ncbi:glycosyltransferase family 2 protein [Pelagicoccus sp. SDUM812002]|uniref:glycosyltransferase family 2 protein n=1 Tax=Pelagicoccus sp. SDUM812002 TaxID=3041266 RepID=UPI0028109C36|nr:glycosyltransferase family 2 protein [Pelagicoccus sp. SDUM812002]MDQ8188062.1 glycosyltransferase family 2 protein [Pelagicoccus sp. SDUM812002]